MERNDLQYEPYDRFADQSEPGTVEGAPPPASTETPPDWTSYLPEQYRDNPQGYFTEQQQVRQELDTLRDYARQADAWIRTYEPVVRTRQAPPATGAEPAGIPVTRQGPAPLPNPLDGLDWEDPRVLETMGQRLWDAVSQRDADYQQRWQMAMDTLEQRTRDLQQLLGFYHSIQSLQNRDLYTHVNYQPTFQEQSLVEYMQQHGLRDPQVAYEQMTADSRMQQAEQRGYERARQELEQQSQRTRPTTTEQTRGTPPRLPQTRNNPYRGYSNNRAALRDHVARTTGVRFDNL